MKNPRISFFFFLGLLFMTVAVAGGCGKKGDPVYLAMTPSPVPSGMQLQRGADSVVVRWVIPRIGESMKFFRLEKSGLDMKGADCPGCPRTFDLLAEIDVADPECQEDNGRGCRLEDEQVTGGYHYIYRLFSCDDAGRCLPVGAPAEIKF